MKRLEKKIGGKLRRNSTDNHDYARNKDERGGKAELKSSYVFSFTQEGNPEGRDKSLH